MPRVSLRFLFVGLCCLSAAPASAQQYRTVDLGTFGGSYSSATAINASGHVVGTARIPDDFAGHPFLWDGTVMHDLGVLAGYVDCTATAINDLEQVVGVCVNPGNGAVEGFMWSATTGILRLGTPLHAEPAGINNSGVVVGGFHPSTSLPSHAFSFQNGTYTDLGEGLAYGINDAGQIVGQGPGPTSRASMWDASGRHDLASIQGSVAYAISPGGLPVGSATFDDWTTAVAFTPDGVANLGTFGRPPAQAFAVRSGLIVGYARSVDGEHAFVYDVNGPGVMIDLDARSQRIPGWTVFSAWGINADGVIAAVGLNIGPNADVKTHAFVLIPTGGPTPTDNLLVDAGFEEYDPPHLGPPGWMSDDFRQVGAISETNQPRSGAKNGACWTTENLDCGMFQDLTAPSTGSYTLTIYANADRPGALVGANVNDETAASAEVAIRGFGNYGDAYVLTFHATQGDTIRVWMYSPAVPGYLVIDDAVLTRSQT
jgi:probable HAF family extracellular repeat protein